MLFIGGLSNAQDVVINEMMASNKTTIQDSDGDYSDWVEIHNTTAQPLNLGDYALSDDPTSKSKWKFPSVILPANGFTVVFASDKNRSDVNQELHSNFKISASGDFLGLYKSEVLVHSLPPRLLSSDESIGLREDGESSIVTFRSPTPGTSNNGSAHLSPIHFTATGGIYDQPFNLKITADNSISTLRYTLDGNPPTVNSPIYPKDGVLLDSAMFSTARLHQVQMTRPELYSPPSGIVPRCILINAASYSPQGVRNSKVVTHSYFIAPYVQDHDMLPILSISMPHYDILDHDSGLLIPGAKWSASNPKYSGNYMQNGKQWERKINLEYIDGARRVLINQHCGIRLHGLANRLLAQKAFRLYARTEYGLSHFSLAVFPDKPFTAYKRLVLKPMTASWSANGCTDHITAKLAKNLNIDYLANKPVVVYMDGEYWGIYFLQERIDERYIAQNRTEVINQDSIDIIESWYGSVAQGDNKDFVDLYDFVAREDLSILANYMEVSDRIDIDNFIDYHLFEIFIANTDWPYNNMKCWRERRSGAKWRWIYFDGDGTLEKIDANGFALATDTIGRGWPTNPEVTLFLRKLLENEEFELKFWSRLEHILNNELIVSQTTKIVKEAKEMLLNEVKNQLIRYEEPASYEEWEESMDFLLRYMKEKPCALISHALRDYDEILKINDCIDFTELGEKTILYPNPNSGTFTYVFNKEKAEISAVEIIDVNGKVIWEKDIDLVEGLNKIEVREFTDKTGIFILRVISEEVIRSMKLLVL